MPPEQAEGRFGAIDKRSDVYSLGAVLYELMTARTPFSGKTTQEILDHVRNDTPPPVQTLSPEAPPELTVICAKAMARAPEDRYASARELADEVSRFMSGALVLAYRYSFTELLRHHYRRHRTAVLSAAAGLLILLTMALYAHLNITRAYHREQEHRAEAESARDTANDANLRLTWENYAVSMTIARKHMDEGSFATALDWLERCPEPLRHWEWGALHNACRPESYVPDLAGSQKISGFLGAFALSPDGRYLLVGRYFRHGRFHVFDLETEDNIFDASTGANFSWPRSFVFAPDSRHFVVPLADDALGLWDLENRMRLRRFEADKGELRAAVFAHDGARLAAFRVAEESDAAVLVWDTATGELLHQFDAARIEPAPGGPLSFSKHTSAIQGAVLGFSQDNRRLVFADTHLRDVDLRTGRQRTFGPVHKTAAYAPGNDTAAFSDPNGHIRVVSLGDHREVFSMPLPQCRELALSPDGRFLIATGGGVRVWDLHANALVYRQMQHLANPQTSANGTVLAGLSELSSRDLLFFPLSDQGGHTYIPLRDATGNDMDLNVDWEGSAFPPHAFSRDNHLLAHADRGGEVSIWALPNFELINQWRPLEQGLFRLNWNHDATRLLLVSEDRKSLSIWDPATQSQIYELRVRAENELFTWGAFSPDGERLAVGCELEDDWSQLGDNMAWLLDARTGEHIDHFGPDTGACNYVKFSPDGRWLLSGSYGDPECASCPSLRVWDAATGKELLGSMNALNWPLQAAFSPDGRHLLVLGLNMQLVLWDLETQQEVYRIRSGEARRVFWHPSGERFGVMRQRGFAVHATLDGRELFAQQGGKMPGFFAEDGRSVIVGNEPGSMLRLRADAWDAAQRDRERTQGAARIKALLQAPPQ